MQVHSSRTVGPQTLKPIISKNIYLNDITFVLQVKVFKYFASGISRLWCYSNCQVKYYLNVRLKEGKITTALYFEDC